MKILVTKWGCAFWTRAARDARGQRSSRAEQGITEGMFRHLLKEHELVYFGRYCGDPLPGMTVIQPEHGLRLDYWSTNKQQLAAFEEDFKAVRGDYAFALANTGPTSSWGHIDNPAGATVRDTDIKNCAPWIDVITRLKLKHVLVVNDIRTYPRVGEMSTTHPGIKPVAWLDQTCKEKIRIIQGKKWRIRPVKAKCETWTDLGPSVNCKKVRTVGVVAHAHIGTGNKQIKRDKAWTDVFGRNKYHIPIYGEGWDYYTGPRIGLDFHGPCTSPQARRCFAECICSPCLAPMDGYATNKPAFMAHQGCVAIPYKDFHVDLDLPMIRGPGDLSKIAKVYEKGTEDALKYIREKMKPDFTLLDDLCSAIEHEDVTTESWKKKFGGCDGV